tara:strand:+ start:370 stop:864 length:495 start_codon:yes stop_codon:yes gene_type:complete
MTQYTWSKATGLDVPAIVQMAESHFQTEIDLIFTPDPVAYARNITFAVVNQFYIPNSTLLTCAKDPEGRLIAYTWAKSGERAAWSDDTMVSVSMAHVDLTLSSRDRLRLITDMINQWEQFAIYTRTPIICSTTMRSDQSAFLKLHTRSGYDVRGSYAYKKINLT